MESETFAVVVSNQNARKRHNNTVKRIEENKRNRYEMKKLPKMPKCIHKAKTYRCKEIRGNDALNFAQNFYSSKSKLIQDAFLQKYCIVNKPKRLDRHLEGPRKSMAIKYYVRTSNGKIIRLCKNAFMGILNVSSDRLKRVCKNYLETGNSPIEKRGGDTRSIKMVTKKNAVIEYIKKFKTVEIHYCRNKLKHRQYLPMELSVNKMYRMYTTTIVHNSELAVKPSYFRYIFNTHFNIGFKAPAKDVCSTCLSFKEQIKVETNSSKRNVLLTNQRVHKLRAKAFFGLLQEINTNMATFSFDCQKNMVLPMVPDQAAYYSRQLYYYNFGIVMGSSHDSLSHENVYLYTWTENLRPKGANEIASAIFHRLCNTDFSNINHIRLVADGCGGQNKNTIMTGMLGYWLANRSPSCVDMVELVFPVTGHSFLPPDRVFAKIEKDVHVKQTIIHPNEYKDIFGQHGTVIQLATPACPVRDWKSGVKAMLKPPSGLHFQFNKCKRFILTKEHNGKIFIRGEIPYKSNIGVGMAFTKKGKNLRNMLLPVQLESGVKINKNKLEDVDKLLKKHFGNDWRNHTSLEFYKTCLDSTQQNVIDEEVELCEFEEADDALIV